MILVFFILPKLGIHMEIYDKNNKHDMETWRKNEQELMYRVAAIVPIVNTEPEEGFGI